MKEAENRVDFDHGFSPDFPDFPIRLSLRWTLFSRNPVRKSRRKIEILTAQGLSDNPTARSDQGDLHIRLRQTEPGINRIEFDRFSVFLLPSSARLEFVISSFS